MKDAIVRYETGKGELLHEYSLAGIGDQVGIPDFDHPTLQEIQPFYFNPSSMTDGHFNPSIEAFRVLREPQFLDEVRPKKHDTVLENRRHHRKLKFTRASEAAIIATGSSIIPMFYGGVGHDIAEIQAGVAVDTVDRGRFGMFITLPKQTRAEVHVDGRNPTLVINASPKDAAGYTLIAPRALRRKGLKICDLTDHPDTIRHYTSPGLGVAFDVSQNPHVGINVNKSEARVVIDLNYARRDAVIDNSIVDSVASPTRSQSMDGENRARQSAWYRARIDADYSFLKGTIR